MQISEVVVLSYRCEPAEPILEVYSTLHGASHRVDELCVDLTDPDNWIVDRSVEGRIFATHSDIGAEMIIQTLKIQSGGVT